MLHYNIKKQKTNENQKTLILQLKRNHGTAKLEARNNDISFVYDHVLQYIRN